MIHPFLEMQKPRGCGALCLLEVQEKGKFRGVVLHDFDEGRLKIHVGEVYQGRQFDELPHLLPSLKLPSLIALVFHGFEA